MTEILWGNGRCNRCSITRRISVTAPISFQIHEIVAMGPNIADRLSDKMCIRDRRWTGALNDSTQKYSIEVNGDTLVFKNSYGSQVATHQVSAADVANGFIDLSAQGLGRVEWDTAPAPDAADPADTQEQALARMIGSAEFVTSQLGEESTQDVEFEIGFNMNFDVTFTAVSYTHLVG